jgi:hypothetical protein
MYNLDGIMLNERYVIYSHEFNKLIGCICSHYSDFNEVDDGIKDRGRPLDLDKHNYVLRVVLSCLYYEWTHSNTKEHRCVRYYKSPNKYVTQSYSHKVVFKVIEWLQLSGHITTKSGYYDRANCRGKTSRMVWERKLSDKFRRLNPVYIFHEHEEVSIKVRDHDKNDLDVYDVTKELYDSLISEYYLVSYGKMLNEINRLRCGSLVTVDEKFYAIAPLYRVYNNSTYGEGGRFYGSAEQQAKKSVRKLFKINNNNTVELDYSNLHISMLYDLKGVKLTQDAYKVLNSDNLPYKRGIIKKALLTMLNAKTRRSAVGAIQDNLTKSKEKGYKAGSIYDDVSSCHNQIADKFGSGSGVRLQNIDSNIALNVMYHFAEKGVLCLCIHDSFIVECHYEEELREVMEKFYRQEMVSEKFKLDERANMLPDSERQFANYLSNNINAIHIGIEVAHQSA